MKLIISIGLAGCCAVFAAATNEVAAPPAGATTNAPAAKASTTQINSDHAEFDLSKHQAVYQGHVRVDRPDAKLTCGWLTVSLPAAGGRLDRIVAETNVVIDFTDEKGEKYHVTAAKAVYEFKSENSVTNELVTFTGNPRVETAQSTIESEPMVWDRVRNKFTFFAPKMISTGAGTNASPLNFLK